MCPGALPGHLPNRQSQRSRPVKGSNITEPPRPCTATPATANRQDTNPGAPAPGCSSADVAGPGTQASLPPRRAVTDWGPSGRGRRQPPAGLAPFGDLGDLPGQAYAPDDPGLMQQETGDYPAAARSHQQALALFSDRGNRPGHAEALTRPGKIPWTPATKQAHRTAAIPATAQGPCRNSGRRASRPPGHANPGTRPPGPKMPPGV
jgi:hypothetical protein